MRNYWNKWIYLAVVMLIGAICSGVFLQALPVEQQERLNEGIVQYAAWLEQLPELEPSMLFWDIFFKHVQWALVLIILGISMIGVPVIVILNFIKGFLLGSSIYMLIQSLGSDGAWLSILSVAPHNLLVIPALIIISSSAISFAGFLFNQRIRKLGGNMKEQVIHFSTVAMTMLLLLAVATLIEVYVSPQLVNWYITDTI